MNLVSDPWIPVTRKDGSFTHVSLEAVFADGREIADLSIRPHERIALLRLLICVAQADSNPVTYLEKWRDAFELLGEGPRFLQARTGKTDVTPISKLVFELATGNNATLFDHGGGDKRALTAAQAGLALLTFQNFSPLIGRGYSGRSPCIDRNMIHSFIQGDDLLDTIEKNCVPASELPCEMGRPVWEQFPTNLSAKPEADSSIRNATETYLGRLVPLARGIWLSEDLTECVLDNGPVFPVFEAYREPSATVIVYKKNEEEKRGLLSAQLEKAIWRQLHAITNLNLGKKSGLGAPLTIAYHQFDEDCALWAGALVSDNQAKILDAVESLFRDLPAGLFHPAGREIYADGVRLAEKWVYALGNACTDYGKALKLDSKPIAGLKSAASGHFWNAAEQAQPRLLDVVRNPAVLEGKRFTEPDAPETDWAVALKQAAWRAYDFACPRRNPRQILAFAEGRKKLRLPKPKSAKKAATTHSKS